MNSVSMSDTQSEFLKPDSLPAEEIGVFEPAAEKKKKKRKGKKSDAHASVEAPTPSSVSVSD
jgi:hypothetical protein